MQANFPAYMTTHVIQNPAFVPFHTKLLSPAEVGTIGCCQLRIKMLMAWKKWFCKKANRTVFIDMQTPDKRCFGAHHASLVWKEPTMQAWQLQGKFVLLKPRKAQYNKQHQWQKWESTRPKEQSNSSDKSKFKQALQDSFIPDSTKNNFIWLAVLFPHFYPWAIRLVCPFFLLILGFDHVFLSQNLPWTKVAVGWSTHQFKSTWKFKLHFQTWVPPPWEHKANTDAAWFLPRMLETHKSQWSTDTPLIT